MNTTEISKNDIKVLILVPHLQNVGGVSYLYNTLKINQHDTIDYFEVQGKRKIAPALRCFEILYLYIAFLWKLPKYDVIHANPSLDRKSFFRDSVYVCLGKLFRKKLLVYWHGWELEFEHKIRSKKVLHKYFQYTFANADMHIVLGCVFKTSLIHLGVRSNVIRIESNAADNSYLDTGISKDREYGKDKSMLNLLFISRVEEAKGIFIAIDTLKLLSMEGNFHLFIAGDGPVLADAKKRVAEENIANITFLGVVKGVEKHTLFLQSDILFFPTYYSEGMPICIIEAMLYGLIVVSRPVGGIPDWVKNEENGCLVESRDAKHFADILKKLSSDTEKLKEMSAKNKESANKHFTPDALNKHLLGYYQQLTKISLGSLYIWILQNSGYLDIFLRDALLLPG